MLVAPTRRPGTAPPSVQRVLGARNVAGGRRVERARVDDEAPVAIPVIYAGYATGAVGSEPRSCLELIPEPFGCDVPVRWRILVGNREAEKIHREFVGHFTII